MARAKRKAAKPRASEGRPEAERASVVVSLRLPREALARLDARAAREGVSRSALVARMALALT